MRGLTLLTATILTFGYGFAAQAAMTVERRTGLRSRGPYGRNREPGGPTPTASGTVGCWIHHHRGSRSP